MGFGFNLFFVFIFVPFGLLMGVLLVSWLLTQKKIFGKIILTIWLVIFGFFLLIASLQWLTTEKKLKKKNYYGQYVVNRNYFKGEQADWQYNTFRFEIKKNDSIYFYVTDKEKILKTYRGTITTTTHRSERLKINMEDPTHHIMSSNPTTYRSIRSFYLVFYSPKFNNVFFKKGKWKPIKKEKIIIKN